jgi:cytoskeletal protein CcmA (bactofilin family)
MQAATVVSTGNCEVRGALTTTGNGTINGTMQAATVVSTGNCEVRGALTTTGNSTVGGAFDAPTIYCGNNCTVDGLLNATTITCDNNCTVTGTMQAATVVCTGNATVSGELHIGPTTDLLQFNNTSYILNTNTNAFFTLRLSRPDGGTRQLTFDNNGNCAADSFTTISDYRIKENIVSLHNLSYSVDNLNPVYYYNTNLQSEDFGFIAHEVQEHFPFLVRGDKDGEKKQSLNYTGIIPLLVKEIQELKKEIQELKKKENQ